MAQKSHSNLAGVNHPLFSTSTISGSSDGIARTIQRAIRVMEEVDVVATRYWISHAKSVTDKRIL